MANIVWLCLTLYFIYVVAFCDIEYSNTFYLAIFILLFSASLVFEQGSKLLDNPIIQALGGSSYSIYLMQFLVLLHKKVDFCGCHCEYVGLSVHCSRRSALHCCGNPCSFSVERPSAKLLRCCVQTAVPIRKRGVKNNGL